MYGKSKTELFSEGMQEITGYLHSILKANRIHLYNDNSCVSIVLGETNMLMYC